MKFIAEYIWIDGKNNLRSKSRTVTMKLPEKMNKNDAMKQILSIDLYEDWSYDGNATWQTTSSDSEIILKPVTIFTDPFRKAPNVLVLCETYQFDGKPTPNNTRIQATEIFNKNLDLKPWYGIEQEFYLMRSNRDNPSEKSTTPLGWPNTDTFPAKQGQYYCSIGASNAFGRKVAEHAYHLILEAGINCSGMNAEVAPGQWEIQIGPCEGIEAADQLILARYIMNRVGELHGVQINLDPKPVKGDWNGSGCHVNFSTEPMRNDGGYNNILNAIKRLESTHYEHMKIYDKDNLLSMNGTGSTGTTGSTHETSNYDQFRYGIGDRSASIRIPRISEKERKGYFEDRRPRSNMDPYLVTSKLFETTSL